MKTSWPSRIRATSDGHSFRAFLEAQLRSRRERNPRYSLRAFAAYLGLHHSTLSQILRGRRTLTAAVIRRIGARLGLGEEVIAAYLAPDGRGERRPTRAELRARQLELDAFEVIADWHHFALLELTRVEGFRPDTRWIARALGITADAVNVAISRLARLGLLEMREHDRWVDRSEHVTMSLGELADPLLRRIQTESHELAIAAIGKTPAARRDHASITVALGSDRLPEIADLVARFRRELEDLVEADAPRDDVYRIDISVFPLTTLNHETETSHA